MAKRENRHAYGTEGCRYGHGPRLDEDLELEQPDTDAVAGGRTSHSKTKDGKGNWRDAKCLAD